MTPAADASSLLRAATGREPGRRALVSGDEVVTYADLDARVDRLSDRLAGACGDGAALAGRRVVVVAPNVPALVVAIFAAWRCGAVVVPLNARLREYDLTRVLEDAAPAAVVSVRSHGGYSLAGAIAGALPGMPDTRACLWVDAAGDVEEVLATDAPDAEPEAVGDGIAGILYTSGSTGEPKGALLRHSAVLGWAECMAGRLELADDDVSVLAIPVSHAFGFGCMLAVVASGGLAVLVDSTFTIEPLLDAATRHGATVLHGSPALFARLLKARPDGLPGVRTGFVGGAACPPEVLEQLDAAGTRILNVFGMTEIGAASGCRSDDPPAVRHRTVGRPFEGYEVRVAPAQGADPGIGEVEFRSPHVTPGYFRRAQATAEAFDGEWFRTGDLGALDASGNLRIAGRAKEVVHVAGFNVFPAEVENALLTHPDVVQAVVIGVAHEQTGEALRAFVVPREGSGLGPADVLRHARARIAGYKLPYAIDLVDELPLLASGKPDRVALAATRENAPSRA